MGEIKLRNFPMCLILVMEENPGERVNYSVIELRLGEFDWILYVLIFQMRRSFGWSGAEINLGYYSGPR